jgi:signal transduction histidine kinase
MRILRIFITLVLSTMIGNVLAEPLGNLPLSALEQRLEEIDAQLAQLANYSLGSGIGAIGYRSMAHETADHPEWIEIDFGTIVPLDEVMLVPAIRRDTENGFQADAFPRAFRLVAGTGEDRDGSVVAEYAGGGLLPRIAPFAISCNGIMASWIRIEAVQLSLRAFDERYVFQLSEILAFSGEENVALHKTVKTASDLPISNPGWDPKYVVDGFMPYLMDAAEGSKSIAYITPPDIDSHPALVMDLGQTYPLSRIHLHAVDQSDTLPQAFIGDFGLPKHMRIEGANQPDFSDAVPLLNLSHETIYDMGSIMMHTFPETACRFIRLKVVEPAPTSFYGQVSPRLGFAEIEVFSKGRNVALGKPIQTNFEQIGTSRPLSGLTDGRNIYGTILPMREWLEQLVARHALETERPLVLAELSRRYTRQKTSLRFMGWLAALLAVGTVITILVDRIIRQRAIFRTRERIAADLHDELGANIHAIGLLSDLAQAAKTSPDKLERLLLRMRALTERTGAAARYCTNMLEAKDLYGDLVDDMRKTSARIMADLDFSIDVEGEENLSRLKPRKRLDLFLFYKECLINTIRHSGATRASAKLTADSKQLSLTITDNGHGLNGEVPSSLKRRARLLGAQVVSEKAESGGTSITLTLRPRWGFRQSIGVGGRVSEPLREVSGVESRKQKPGDIR